MSTVRRCVERTVSRTVSRVTGGGSGAASIYGTWFDGVDTKVEVFGAGLFPYDRNDAFGIEVGAQVGDGDGLLQVFIGDNDASSPFDGLRFGFLSGGELEITFRIGVSNSISVKSNATYDDGVYRVYKFTYDGSRSASGITLYVDDVSVAKTTVADTFSVDQTFHSGLVTNIGCRGSTSLWTEGVLRDVKILNASGVAVNHWIGDGVADSNWTDQVGSDNGTVSGTPNRATSTDEGVTWTEDWAGPQSLRVASFNIYNWSEATIGTTKYNAVEDSIQRVDADILALQEINTAGSAIITSNLAPDNGYDEYFGGTGSLQPAILTKTAITKGTETVLAEFGGGSKELNRKPRYVEHNFGHSSKLLGVYSIHSWTFSFTGYDINAPERDYERCIEMRRILEDAGDRMAANPDLEIIIMGDFNQDNVLVDHIHTFAAAVTPASSTDSGVAVAASTATFPLADSLQQIADSSEFTLYEPENIDGDRLTLWDTDPNVAIDVAVAVDKFALSSGLTMVGSEVLDSEATQTGGLTKSGSALASAVSRDASDHKMIFADIIFN